MTEVEVESDHYPIFDPQSIAAERNRHVAPRKVNLGGTPAWLVSRYDEVRECLSTPAMSPAPAYAAEHGQHSPLSGLFADTVVGSNPPEHTRLRRPFTRVLTVRRVDKMREAIQTTVDALLDKIAADGTADLVPSLGVPQAMLTICHLLGIPDADTDRIHRLTQAMLQSGFDPAAVAAGQTASQQLMDYFAELTEGKRENPGDDLISDLIALNAEERLSDTELVAAGRVLMIAGYELTSGFISNCIYAILSRPALADRFRAQPDIDQREVDELLRHDGPGLFNVRFVNVETTVGDAVMRPGEQVLLDMEAANSDPDHYRDGTELDLGRREATHVGFGYGIHYCVGATLARVEGEVAINTLFRRFPDIELAKPASEMGRNPNPFQRSLSELPVRFTPKS